MMPSYGIFQNGHRLQALLTEDDCRIPFTEDGYEQIEGLTAEGVIKYNIRARRDLAEMHGLFVYRETEKEADEHIIKPFLARATTAFHLDSASHSSILHRALTEILHSSLWYIYIGCLRSEIR